MRFKIDWSSLIVGSKFTLLCFTLYLRAIFHVQAPAGEGGGGLYLERQFNGGFFELPVWGAYFWRGLYMEGNFTVFECFEKSKGEDGKK